MLRRVSRPRIVRPLPLPRQFGAYRSALDRSGARKPLICFAVLATSRKVRPGKFGTGSVGSAARRGVEKRPCESSAYAHHAGL